MKMAGIREIREKSGEYLSSLEPFLVTKHGKISGVYIPLDDPDRLPDDWRKEIIRALGVHFSRLLESTHISEKDIHHDFLAYRRGRRRR
jgi:hypothetical protein